MPLQYLIGNLVLACVLAGVIALGLAGLGLYAGATKHVKLLRAYGVCCILVLTVCLAGFIRGLIGVNQAPSAVSNLSDDDLVTQFTLIRSRSELTGDLQTFYWVYVAGGRGHGVTRTLLSTQVVWLARLAHVCAMLQQQLLVAATAALPVFLLWMSGCCFRVATCLLRGFA